MNMQNNFVLRGVHVLVCLMIMVVVLCLPCPSVEATLYQQHNLVSDIPGLADITDPNLVNPWGISFSATSPFWVSDNGTGLSTLYSVNPITNATTKVALEVTIPAGGSVTGQVFNGGAAFNGDRFLFVSEDGTISGWRGALGTTAETLQIGSVDNVYKGVALATIGANTYLYAANFHSGAIDVVKGAGAPNLTGNFTDPALPSGFAPFNIQNLGGNLYVTYAVQDPARHDDVAGAGNGVVDVYDTNGNLIGRLISNGPLSPLNSPWGLALAPASFGEFGNDLLVGNFGDGTINAFDPLTGTFEGSLLNELGNPLTIEGLWGLKFGNGGSGGNPDKLYFTAGIPSPGSDVLEEHGLFGSISVPEPSTFLLLGAGLAGVGLLRRRSKK